MLLETPGGLSYWTASSDRGSVPTSPAATTPMQDHHPDVQGGRAWTPALSPYTTTSASAFKGQSPGPIPQVMNTNEFSVPQFASSSLSRYRHHDEVRLRRKLVMLKEQHKHDHPDTLNALHRLGAVLIEQGRYRSAEEVIRELLSKCRQKHGDEHNETAASLSLLGEVLRLQGHFQLAKKILERAHMLWRT